MQGNNYDREFIIDSLLRTPGERFPAARWRGWAHDEEIDPEWVDNLLQELTRKGLLSVVPDGYRITGRQRTLTAWANGPKPKVKKTRKRVRT